MAQPESGPAALDEVKRLANVNDNADDVALTGVVGAVNAVVRGLPVSQLPDPAEGEPAPEWPASVVYGANMLGARLWRRKSSPAGVEAFGAEGPFYVQRNDPDIALLLQLGAYAPPAVG